MVLLGSKKIDSVIWALYRPVLAGVHTWWEMCQMYDDEVHLANRMVDLLEDTIRK